MAEKLKIGALISGGGTNLQAIIDACEAGEINAEIAFVGSDHPGVKGLDRAAKHGIPSFVMEYGPILKNPEDYPAAPGLDLDDVISKQHLFYGEGALERAEPYCAVRAVAEAQLLKEMDKFEYDVLVLAGFMRIFTPYIIDKINKGHDLPRIMNIHPALLPAFPGVDGYGDTFKYGCKVGGCTVHFVDYGEDSGPIIGQKAYTIDPGDTEEDIRKKGLELEWRLYPECIGLYADGRLSLTKRGRRTVVEVSK
ncbi:phosphoribosylglycinamide formyltransferase [Desulfatibacillum aliphaticivorans]|uniref:Phosphoribosylglycinamide formyltransferase n=1 Tax=Desulfatibacillum aliphaticivorans TaxID=218208 RepID=B8FEY8_DESAL|nr:phosphoribosylglycinamide formyltransferase [Desulfatibacillum aliphaticivorans]ACL03665.1 phosphoribosylglycinamide formyltransferase [Desulfatibacillum aliphaticivorans]